MEIGTDKPFGTIPRLEYALMTDDGAPVIYDAPRPCRKRSRPSES